jgi:uncharacterized membrane protein YciS (DUF1049 family)
MKNFLLKMKEYLMIILAIAFIIIIFIGIIAFIFYLKNNNKKLQIHPEFKIIDCKKEDVEVLSDAVDVAKEILNKVKK